MKSLTKPLIHLLIFLFPVFFIPVPAQTWEINKMALLVMGAMLILAVYVIERLFLQKTLPLTNSFVAKAVGIFTLTAVASLVLSRDWYYSLIGMHGDMAGSFVSLLALAILFWIIVSSFGKQDVQRAWGVFSLSSFVATVLFLGSLLGPVRSIFGGQVPAGLSLATGDLNQFALFLSVMTLISVAISIFTADRMRARLAYLIFGIIALLTVLIIYYQPALYVLIFGFVGIFVVYFNRLSAQESEGGSKQSVTLRNLSMALSLVGIALITSFVFYSPFPGLNTSEVFVKTGESTNIVRQTWANYPLTGTGLQTVMFNWSQYHSESINETSAWNARFNDLGNEWFNIAVEGGILMTLGWLVLILAMGFFGGITLIAKRKSLDGTLIGLILGQGALIIISFITSFSVMLWFTFFVLLALTTALYNEQGLFKGKSRKVNVNNIPGIYASVLGLGGVAVFIGMFITVFAGVNFYRADVAYAQALRSSDVKTQVKHMETAVELNPYSTVYSRGLVQVRLSQMQQEAQKLNSSSQQSGTSASSGSQSSDQERRDQIQRIRSILQSGQQLVERVTQTHSEDIRAYELAGSFYLEAMTYQAGLKEQTVLNALDKTIKLDPANPAHHRRKAEYYITKAQQLQARQQRQSQQASGGPQDSSSGEAKITEALNQAEANIKKALELKQSYAQGYQTYATIYALREQSEKQIAKLKEYQSYVQQNNIPMDRETYFALGRAYFNNEQLDKAKTVFKRITEQFPGYTNALYSLGLVAETQGNIQEARQYFEQVRDILPNNQTVKQKLQELGESSASDQGTTSSGSSELGEELPDDTKTDSSETSSFDSSSETGDSLDPSSTDSDLE